MLTVKLSVFAQVEYDHLARFEAEAWQKSTEPVGGGPKGKKGEFAARVSKVTSR